MEFFVLGKKSFFPVSGHVEVLHGTTPSGAQPPIGGRRYLQHVGRLLAPLGHVLRLGQQVVEEARLVELADQLALEAVLDVVDQEVHHRLGHAAVEDAGERSV